MQGSVFGNIRKALFWENIRNGFFWENTRFLFFIFFSTLEVKGFIFRNLRADFFWENIRKYDIFFNIAAIKFHFRKYKEFLKGVFFLVWGNAAIFQSMKNAAKSIESGEHGKLIFTASLKYLYSFPIRYPSYCIVYHVGNTCLFPSISNSTRKCSKIHSVRSQVFFPQYYCFYLFQNLVIT